MTESRRIPVPGTYNFRDAGGGPARGGVVRSGKLFRSDALHEIGDDGRAVLRELGIRIVVDLRDDDEAELMPDDLGDLDLAVVRVPILEGTASEPARGPMTLEGLYEDIVRTHAPALATALRTIAESGTDPVLVHCTAGKDRTGLVVALALTASGVARRAVIGDYVGSETNLGGQWLATMLGLAEAQGIAPTPRLRTLIGGSPPEALDATLNTIEREHGSVYGYLRSAGLSADEVAGLRSALVDETADTASAVMGIS